MLPISEIHEGDMFANPMFVNDRIQGNIYRVEKVNVPEKMVCIQAYGWANLEPLMAPFWKKNTDRMFSESWRYA